VHLGEHWRRHLDLCACCVASTAAAAAALPQTQALTTREQTNYFRTLVSTGAVIAIFAAAALPR
jgi:hypothetical protein